jgi:hypothetical protein
VIPFTPSGVTYLLDVRKGAGNSYGVPVLPTARVLSRGHSYGVTESLGIAVLSRGHSL